MGELYAERLEAARALLAAGRGQEILFRMDEWDGAPVCAQRWASLAARNAVDDMFSSDLRDDELRVRAKLPPPLPPFGVCFFFFRKLN